MSSERLQLEETVEFEADAARTWARVGDFAGVDTWAIGVRVEQAGAREPGSIRSLRMGRHAATEKLEAIDDTHRMLRYRLLAGPLPVRDYLSTLRVEPAGPGRCRVRWSADCIAEGIAPQRLEQVLRGAYRESLLRLAGQLSPTPAHHPSSGPAPR